MYIFTVFNSFSPKMQEQMTLHYVSPCENISKTLLQLYSEDPMQRIRNLRWKKISASFACWNQSVSEFQTSELNAGSMDYSVCMHKLEVDLQSEALSLKYCLGIRLFDAWQEPSAGGIRFKGSCCLTTNHW